MNQKGSFEVKSMGKISSNLLIKIQQKINFQNNINKQKKDVIGILYCKTNFEIKQNDAKINSI